MFDFLGYAPASSYLPERMPVSYIRFLNSSPSIKKFDAYVSSHQVSKNISFKKYTPYLSIPAGQHIVSIYPPGSDRKAYASIENIFGKNLVYTICAIQPDSLTSLLLIPDIRVDSENDSANIRFVNLTPAQFSIAPVNQDRSPLILGLATGCISPYESFQPGKYSFQAQGSESGDSPLKIADIVLKPGWNCTVYLTVSGEKNKFSYITLLDGSTYIK